MKIIIDADACPVIDIAVGISKKRNIDCILVCDNTHFIQKDGAETVVVDKGTDSADCKVANLTEKGDIVITQDYGLAALVLGKGGKALNQNGLIYTDANIENLLFTLSGVLFTICPPIKKVYLSLEKKKFKRFVAKIGKHVD